MSEADVSSRQPNPPHPVVAGAFERTQLPSVPAAALTASAAVNTLRRLKSAAS